MTSILTPPGVHDAHTAYDLVSTRAWVNGRVCPKGGTVGESGKLNGKFSANGPDERPCTVRSPFFEMVEKLE
ncbi:MAG: hypothetical protein KIS74_02085 [Burkholderiales bacterium]|nr:hypothetical protein [Burkholderiales bacterium]